MSLATFATFSRWSCRLVASLRDPAAQGRWALFMGLLATVPRLWFGLEAHPPELYLLGDMAFYDLRADHLRAGDLSIWDTFTPPGYPALLALVYSIFGKRYDAVAVMQALMGGACVTLVHLLALRISGRVTAAFLASLGLATYLPLVLYTGFLLTEVPCSFLLVLFVWLLLSAADGDLCGRALGAGAVLAAATAMRPNLLVFLPLFVAWGFALRRGAPARARAAARALAVALPLLALVSLYNSRLAGRPVGIATNGGINFYLAHAEVRGVRLRAGDPIREVNSYHNRIRYTAVFETDRHAYEESFFYGEGLRILAERPGRLLSAFGNLADGLGLGEIRGWPDQAYWPGWAEHDAEMGGFARGAFFGLVAPTFVHALILARRRRLFRAEEASRLLLLGLIASVVIVLYALSGNPRVRVSFDPIFFVLASDAAVRAGEWARERLRAARGVPSAG